MNRFGKWMGCIGLVVGVAVGSQSAMARSPLAEDFLLGVHAVKQCDIPELGKSQKILVRRSIDSLHQVPTLLMIGYSEDSRRDFAIRLGSGTVPDGASDGTETWSTSIDGNTLTAIETYERKNKRGRPDLGYRTTYEFQTVGLKTKIDVKTVRLYGHAKDSSYSCELSSLRRVATQVYPQELTKVAQQLESLEPKLGDADYDQATVQFERVKLNVLSPTDDQVREVVGITHLIEFPGFSEIKVRQMTGAFDSAQYAEVAMETVTGIADSFIAEAETDEERERLIKEYAPLREYVSFLEKALAQLPAKYKVFLLEWSASDSDGSGLFIIDTETGEAIYLGSHYFS